MRTRALSDRAAILRKSSWHEDSRKAALETLLGRRDLWRGDAVPAAEPTGVSTGFAALDALLSWGGWPPGALSEVLGGFPAAALALVCPLLARLGGEARWLLLIDPPLVPYAPALAAAGVDLARLVVVEAAAQAPWAAEQGLRSGACGAVLVWGGQWPMVALRRLQLAAEAGGTVALLFREAAAAQMPSAAVLRLSVQPVAGAGPGLDVRVLKQRGGRTGGVELSGGAWLSSVVRLGAAERSQGFVEQGRAL